MSVGDWVALGIVAPLILVGGWVQTARVWLRQADVSAGVTWFTGRESAVGMHAFALPGMTGMSLVYLGVVGGLIAGNAQSPSTLLLVEWIAGIGVLMLALGFWMWLFAWPRFLVPPHLRGKPGWAGAAWRSLREARAQRPSPPQTRGGEHARW